MITVACVLVSGHVGYTPEYVANLRAMVDRHLREPCRFVCFTDAPVSVAGVEPIPVERMPGFGWWSKLHLFRPDNGLKGRVLYLDLDVLVVGDLAPVVHVDSTFALLPDGGSTFQPKDGRRVVKRFNSSVMVFDAGSEDGLWSAFTPAVADRLWGDQDWIAECRPGADMLPIEWFPRLSSIGPSGAIPAEARVVLAKKPKPAVAAQRWPWFAERWRVA